MTQNRPFILYISAAADLISEREALARMVAELPVTLAWRILQTPLYETDLHDLESLQIADFFILLMGMDIRAPVGLELRVAQTVNCPTIAYLKKEIPRTPAGQNFVHDAGVSWQPFANQADLTYHTRRVLISHLLRFRRDYGLSLVEITQLEEIQAMEPAKDTPLEAKDAGHSAVILSRERYEPSDGILLSDLVDESDD